ncbi:MAG TPA: hypothetical protein VFU23_07850, partial [Gemmatimonadales bacterium]|nr:hypothetical protein [Gemmatimonadales bacterium]
MADSARRWFEQPLVQLTLVRLREVIREPEAIFWIFLFPVLMTAGLGIAFRSKPESASKVAVLAGSRWSRQTAERLKANPLIEPQVLDDSGAARALRTG